MYFILYDFVQNSPAFVQKNHQIMYGETLDFQSQSQECNIKCLIGKSFFAVNLPLNIFRATIANTDTENLKSLHTLFNTYFYQIIWSKLFKI